MPSRSSACMPLSRNRLKVQRDSAPLDAVDGGTVGFDRLTGEKLTCATRFSWSIGLHLWGHPVRSRDTEQRPGPQFFGELAKVHPVNRQDEQFNCPDGQDG